MKSDPNMGLLKNDGYAYLGDVSDHALGDTILEFLKRGRHRTKIFGDHIGIRPHGLPNLSTAHPWTTITYDNYQPFRLSTAIERYLHSHFGQYFYEHNPISVPWDEVLFASTYLSNGLPTPRDWELLARIISRCKSHDLLKCLEKIVFPKYFAWKPHGSIQVYFQDEDNEKHFAEMRILRIAQSLDIDHHDGSAPGAMNKWQMSNPHEMFNLFLEWSGTITYPIIQNYLFGPLGLTMNFCDDEVSIYTPPPYPCSFNDIKIGKSNFGIFSKPLEFQGSKIVAEPETHHGRAVWAESYSNAIDLQSWVANKASILIKNLTNLSLYEETAVNHKGIDLAFPYEQTATIDRLVRRVLWLNTAEMRSVSRIPIFEIADCIATLKHRWTGEKEAEVFKSLFSLDYSQNVLQPLLESIPSPWGTRFARTAEYAYQDLHESVLASVWDRVRLNQDEIDLSAACDKSEIYSNDKFVTDVVRDLRNTHHGYFPHKRFPVIRRRLSLISGELSPQISALPSLWLLAILQDSYSMLGWRNTVK